METTKQIKEMSNAELVSLLVGVGAENLHISKLSDILEAPATVYGIGEKRKRKLEAVGEIVRRLNIEQTEPKYTIHGPEDAAHILFPRVKFEQKEHFMLVCLDTKNHVTDISDISVGSLTASVVHPREVFKEAVSRSAASVIIAHNHPSGDPSPSREDIAVTQRLVKAGKVMDIPVLDHIILGNERFVSLKEKGMMN